MNWRGKVKNTPAASTAHLAINRAEIEAEIEKLEAEQTEIEQAFAELSVDPARFQDATDRLREIQATLPTKRYTLQLIAAEIPKAERRERLAKLAADKADLERQSDKLAKGLAERYERAAEALAAIVREIEADWDAWELMNMKLHDAREPGGWTAERRAREACGNFDAFTDASIILDSHVVGWDGQPLFRGRRVSIG